MGSLLHDVGEKQKDTQIIKYDNQSSIALAKNPVFQKNTKNIDTQLHFVREKVAENNIKLEYVGTKEKIIDIFTEPLPREAFEYLRQKLGILPSSHYIFLIQKIKGEWKCVQVRRMVV